MSDYCLSCGTELHHYDTGSDCLRCEAEQAHDYDVEPNVEFDRCGSMIEESKRRRKLLALSEELDLDYSELETMMDNAVFELSCIWAEEPLDGDQTKRLAKLFRLFLDDANGNL